MAAETAQGREETAPESPPESHGATPEERVAGALSGFHVGEVLGGFGEGVSPAGAVAALQEAFPDFSQQTPGTAYLSRLLSGETSASRAEAPAVSGIPGWVTVAVATGLQHACDPVAQLVAEVEGRLAPTEQSRLQRAGAAAVATAVSAARTDAPWPQCLSLAVSAADAAESDTSMPYGAGPSLAARLTWAHALATRSNDDPGEVIALLVGTSEVPQEAVPAVFAVLGVMVREATEAGIDRAGAKPLDAARRAAVLGGRSTIIAALAGAITGAFAGVEAVPAHMRVQYPPTEARAGTVPGGPVPDPLLSRR